MKIFLIAIIALLPLQLFAADFSIAELDKFMHARNFPAADKYLSSFPADSRDPDLIISRGWVALSWGFYENLCIDIPLKDGGSLKCYPDAEDRKKLRAQGIAILEKAVIDFPDRIDARLNLIGCYIELGRFADFKNMTLAMLKHGTAIKNKWLMRGKEPISDGRQFLLSNLQANMVKLQQIDAREAEAVYIDAAKAMIEYAPDHVYGYNDLGIMYKILKQPKLALPPVLKAHELEPDDVVVMGNLSQIYIALGEKQKARAMLKKMIAHPSGQFRDRAEKMLRELDEPRQ